VAHDEAAIVEPGGFGRTVAYTVTGVGAALAPRVFFKKRYPAARLPVLTRSLEQSFPSLTRWLDIWMFTNLRWVRWPG
jgi:hypothetical protein